MVPGAADTDSDFSTLRFSRSDCSCLPGVVVLAVFGAVDAVEADVSLSWKILQVLFISVKVALNDASDINWISS